MSVSTVHKYHLPTSPGEITLAISGTVRKVLGVEVQRGAPVLYVLVHLTDSETPLRVRTMLTGEALPDSELRGVICPAGAAMLAGDNYVLHYFTDRR